MSSAVDKIDASVFYIEDDPRFQTEKPYICLLPNPGFEPTNCQFGCSTPTTIKDLRSLPSTVDFAEYGFTVVPHETCMRFDIALPFRTPFPARTATMRFIDASSVRLSSSATSHNNRMTLGTLRAWVECWTQDRGEALLNSVIDHVPEPYFKGADTAVIGM